MLNRWKASLLAKIFLIILLGAGVTFLFFGSRYPDFWKILQKLSFNFSGLEVSIWFILKGVLTFVALLSFTSLFLEKIETKINTVKYLTPSKKTLLIKVIQTLMYIVVFIISLDILSLDLATFTVFSGAIGVGIGFGLQKVASNFISGLILLSEKSIETNDLLELSDGTLGYVRYTGARYTLLRSEDGIEIIIPNDELLANRVINWTYSDKQAALKIDIQVDYESNIEKALAIMKQVAFAHQAILEVPLPAANIERIDYDSVTLTLTFWLSNITEDRELIKTGLFSQIISGFKDNAIKIARKVSTS